MWICKSVFSSYIGFQDQYGLCTCNIKTMISVDSAIPNTLVSIHVYVMSFLMHVTIIFVQHVVFTCTVYNSHFVLSVFSDT